MSDERHEAVSRRAYELWEQEGGEHGRHEDHWHRAAGEIGGGSGDVAVTAPDGTTMDVAAAPAKKPAAKPRAKAGAASTPTSADPAVKPPKTKSTR